QAVPFKKALRILVVEDEPLIRQILIRYLEADNHSVEIAINGREGLEKFLTGYFDLIITDRAMPEMSGDQMASAIKKEWPDKPILMITGFGDIMEARGESVDVDLVINKPFTLSDIREAVGKVIHDKTTPARKSSSKTDQ
ncbi:MAG: response regulator, partial [Deltaproteobacteria bacterium]|nr:response regulator [Deltaproteobacteria bacterium]